MKASLEIVQRGVIWMAELKVDGEECGQCSWATAKEQANNRRKRSCWKKVKP